MENKQSGLARAFATLFLACQFTKLLLLFNVDGARSGFKQFACLPARQVGQQ